jgi:hypothetical protein
LEVGVLTNTVFDTNYVYERDEQTISKRDVSERDSSMLQMLWVYKDDGTLQTR